MVRIQGVVLEDERAGRRAQKCRGLHLVDDAGNQIGYIDFSNTGELNLWLDPRISVTMEAGGLEFNRHMSDCKVGHYYCPVNPTVENNLDTISRHLEDLKARDIHVESTSAKELKIPKLYSFTTRSR